MTRPEDAVAAARRAAAEQRASGAYPDPPLDALRRREEAEPSERLLSWALIDPDVREVRSTRRFGRPITLLKQGLLRLLLQYHMLLLAEQSRFNVSITLYVRQLEKRVAELEAELERSPR